MILYADMDRDNKNMIDWPFNVTQNKYTKWYKELIVNATNRTLPEGIYTENHHIIPYCMTRNNKKSNIVSLTAREHFIAHLLLWKITMPKKWHNKMMMALYVMSNGSGNDFKKQKQNRQPLKLKNSKLYEKFIAERRKYLGELSSERWKDPAYKKNFSDKIKERWKDPEYKKQMAQKRKNYILNNPGVKQRLSSWSKELWDNRTDKEHNELLDKTLRKVAKERKGKTYEEIYTPEQIKNLHTARENRVIPPESRERMRLGLLKGTKAPMPEHVKKQVSKRMTGIKRPTIKCKHCGLVAVVSNINRWHGDNCKQRPGK